MAILRRNFREDEAVEMVRVAGWDRYSWLRHGFSTRAGGVSTVYGGAGLDSEGLNLGVLNLGSLNLGWTKEDDPAAVAENRRRFLESVAGGSEAKAVTLRQVHGAELLVVRDRDAAYETAEGRAAIDADGVMTDVRGVLLAIQTADCVPVMLVDVEQRVVAVFHAGWRGTVAGIVEQGVSRMRQEYGSRTEAMAAAIGPSIGACCYAVGAEVREAFAKRYEYAAELFAGQRLDRLDLWEANRRQLMGAGIAAERITVVGECTGCALGHGGRRKYFSHRVDAGITGRMMSVVGIV